MDIATKKYIKGIRKAMGWISVRVELNLDGSIAEISCGEDITWDVALLEEKLALLKLVPVGAGVDGIGKRWGRYVYYLRFYKGEYVTNMEIEDEV
jgi:hypothetical protein